jgi:hypothetical protein
MGWETLLWHSSSLSAKTSTLLRDVRAEQLIVLT